MKVKRQNKIIELIEKNNVETQEQLLDLLIKSGFNVTQATISRDINELRLIKVQSGNSYKYTSGISDPDKTPKYRIILTETVTKVDYANNLVVVKCLSGMAQAAAAAIDVANFPDVVGTIAGDDTILLVMRGEENAVNFVASLNKIIKSED